MINLTVRINKAGLKADYLVLKVEDDRCLDEIYTLCRLCEPTWVIARIEDSTYFDYPLYQFILDSKHSPITYA